MKIWKDEGIDLKPYPGYKFGHKKIIDKRGVDLFETMVLYYGVKVFRKTSCLFSYVHRLSRDYNAHYYRPTELNCTNCVMYDKCMSYKNSLPLNND